MALIKCSECGKEISDKASACPNCGCPIKIENAETTNNTSQNQSNNKSNKKIIIIILLVMFVIMLLCAGFIFYLKVVQPQKTEERKNATYKEAIELLENGKYEEGKDLLQTISEYKDVNHILDQIEWESYAYEAINCVKPHLKNPDSFQLYEIIFYAPKDEDGITITDTRNMRPIILMHYGAQNGFGGNTTGYAICNYEWDNREYNFVGSCKSLNEKDYNEKDIEEMIICKTINIFRNDYDAIGNVDLNRIKTVLKNDAYITNKIIK